MTKQTDLIINGNNFRIFHETPRFIEEVIQNNEYRAIFEDLVVIDLGCNIGTFSFWIYDKASVIYAIDPAPDVIELLNESIKINNLHKIRSFQLAISGTGGMREIDDEHEGTSGSWRLTNGTFAKHEVPTQTISQFMYSQNIDWVDVLKIDVEGGEHEIFESSGFKEASPKIKSIIGEFHGISPAKILEDCGYRVTIDESKRQFVARRA